MGVVFLGSEFDSNAWELAARIKGQVKGVRPVRLEDPNGLLGISDEDVILWVARGVGQPEIMKPDELRRRNDSGLHAFGLVEFLVKMEKIGRAKGVSIILVPEQSDEDDISSIGEMLQK
ncbi:MAG: hypothetical protein JXC85_03915 [Candidatus Aenigmarchaeota archaeon]|nr:hypothetical protein [Candidatus Aenigmarchaeota archaeon]